MVWDIQSARNDREGALCAFLLQEMETRCAATTRQSRALYQDVARSVAVYCADEVGRGVPSSELHALFSRALWGVGETSVARQVLDHHVDQRAIRETLQALLSVNEVSPLLWRSVVRGVIRRRTKWATADDVPLWVLDVMRLDTASCDMELARFLMVRTLLISLTPVWNASSGRGALAVRCGMASPEARNLLMLCRGVLARESEQREWRVVPRIWHVR